MLPIEKKLEHLTPNNVEVTLFLPAELAWFEGHFDSQPILPGVAQIEWAMHYAQQVLDIQAAFSSLEQVKFLSPILPLDTIQLSLGWDSQLNKLQFSYFTLQEKATEPVLMSRGKIRLCS